MTPTLTAQWLLITPTAWAIANASVLHRAGLTPEQAQRLHNQVDTSVAMNISRLVDAAHMAALDTQYLHWWATSGLLRPITNDVPMMRVPGHVVRTPSFTRWVTLARRYIAACGGNERLAALAAAAHLPATEAAEQLAAGTLSEEALLMLVALREAGPSEPPTHLF